MIKVTLGVLEHLRIRPDMTQTSIGFLGGSCFAGGGHTWTDCWPTKCYCGFPKQVLAQCILHNREHTFLLLGACVRGTLPAEWIIVLVLSWATGQLPTRARELSNCPKHLTGKSEGPLFGNMAAASSLRSSPLEGVQANFKFSGGGGVSLG